MRPDFQNRLYTFLMFNCNGIGHALDAGTKPFWIQNVISPESCQSFIRLVQKSLRVLPFGNALCGFKCSCIVRNETIGHIFCIITHKNGQRATYTVVSVANTILRSHVVTIRPIITFITRY